MPRSDAKASGRRATLGFPCLAFAFPIFLPLLPSQPAAPLPIPIALPTARRTSWAAQGAVCSAVQSSQTLPACVKCNLLNRTKRLQTRVEFWQASGLVAKGCSWLSDRKQDCFSPPLAPQMLPPPHLCMPREIRLITLACLR